MNSILGLAGRGFSTFVCKFLPLLLVEPRHGREKDQKKQVSRLA
jgi:hypothetical protein